GPGPLGRGGLRVRDGPWGDRDEAGEQGEQGGGTTAHERDSAGFTLGYPTQAVGLGSRSSALRALKRGRSATPPEAVTLVGNAGARAMSSFQPRRAVLLEPRPTAWVSGRQTPS